MKTCQSGHARTKANTYMYDDPKWGPRKMCRPCRARNMRASRVLHGEPVRDRSEFRRINRDRLNADRRAHYRANRKKYAALSRIKHISKKLNPSEGEIAQAWELRKMYPAVGVRR